MNERIETDFEELKEYEEIENYYEYLVQAEYFFRDVFGDRVESQKYIVRANKELERLHSIIKEVREYIEENYPTSTINYQDDKYKLLEILDKENK